MTFECKHGHRPPEHHRIEEVDGPVATLHLDHVYEATYPDHCPADTQGKYSLYVRGQYIEHAVTGMPLLDVLREIAMKMNEGS